MSHNEHEGIVQQGSSCWGSGHSWRKGNEDAEIDIRRIEGAEVWDVTVTILSFYVRICRLLGVPIDMEIHKLVLVATVETWAGESHEPLGRRFEGDMTADRRLGVRR